MADFDEINQRFKEALRELETSRTEKFLTDIMDAVETGAKSMTPIGVTGNLIDSWFANTARDTSGWFGEFGYGAEYAIYVHEAPGTLLGTGLAWNPDAEPKFLEKAVQNVFATDLNAIIERQYRL